MVLKGRNDTTLVFGTTDAGRHLVVMLVQDDGALTVFVVMARQMTADERRMFQRKVR